MSLDAQTIADFKELLRAAAKSDQPLKPGTAEKIAPHAFLAPPKDGSEFVLVFRRSGPVALVGVLGGIMYVGISYVPAALYDSVAFGPKHPLGREIAEGTTEVHRSTDKISLRLSAEEIQSLASAIFTQGAEGKTLAFALAQYAAPPAKAVFAELAAALDEGAPVKIQRAYESAGVAMARG